MVRAAPAAPLSPGAAPSHREHIGTCRHFCNCVSAWNHGIGWCEWDLASHEPAMGRGQTCNFPPSSICRRRRMNTSQYTPNSLHQLDLEEAFELSLNCLSSWQLSQDEILWLRKRKPGALSHDKATAKHSKTSHEKGIVLGHTWIPPLKPPFWLKTSSYHLLSCTRHIGVDSPVFVAQNSGINCVQPSFPPYTCPPHMHVAQPRFIMSLAAG